MKVNGKTDIGRMRAENQDNYRAAIVPGGMAWGVVCDGMGGAQNGKQASHIAVDTLESVLDGQTVQQGTEDEVQDLLLAAIEQANLDVYENSGGGEVVMGTTVVAAVVRRGVLHLAHAGDSRAYLFENDTLKLLTRDHSMVQELVDQGALSPVEANHHPDKNVITRALGVESVLKAEYGRGAMCPGATLLLCTDGLTNMLENEHIAQIMADTDFYELADELIAQALRAGGSDNITVVLMQMEEEDTDG